MLRVALFTLWPSFLIAIVAEGCFFSIYDPAELLHLGGLNDLPPIAAYTLGFFFFWVFCGLASMLTYYLLKVPRDHQPPI